MRPKGLIVGLLAVAIAVAVGRGIAAAVAKKTMMEGGRRGMQDRLMGLWDEIPDTAPPKRFLAAIEGIRADVARIREVLEDKNETDSANDS